MAGPGRIEKIPGSRRSPGSRMPQRSKDFWGWVARDVERERLGLERDSSLTFAGDRMRRKIAERKGKSGAKGRSKGSGGAS